MGLSDLVIGQSVFDLGVQIFCPDLSQRHFFCLCSGGISGAEVATMTCQALMGGPQSCFHFQEVDVFQRADKEPGCS